MNNKSNSKIEKKPKPKHKTKQKKIIKGGVGDISDTSKLSKLVIYTKNYKEIWNKLPEHITKEAVQEKFVEETEFVKDITDIIKQIFFFGRKRLVLMLQPSKFDKTYLDKFYKDIESVLDVAKSKNHKIYVFLPFFCNDTEIDPMFFSINDIIKRNNFLKYRYISHKDKIYFYQIDETQRKITNDKKFFALATNFHGSCNNQNLPHNAIKDMTAIFEHIFNKKNDKGNAVNGESYTGNTQPQTSIPRNMMQTRYLNMYGVDAIPAWKPYIQQSHLRKLEINGTQDENVLILGDSWSAGYYIDSYNNQNNSKNLAKYVSFYSNKNIYYPDGGAFGYTSRDLLFFLNNEFTYNSQILKEYLQKHVGIVVLFIGINDQGNNISPQQTEENKKKIKEKLREFKNISKILVVEYPKNLFQLSNSLSMQFPNQYSNISSSIMGAPMFNFAPVSGYHKYGKEIAEGIKSLENKNESTLQLTDLQPGDLSINDSSKLHLSTDSEISIYRRVGGKNNKKQKYVKYKTKEVLGKKRQIFRKNDSKSKKEYIKYKNECILVKEYIKIKKSTRK